MASKAHIRHLLFTAGGVAGHDRCCRGVKVTSRDPVFYRSERIGPDGVPLVLGEEQPIVSSSEGVTGHLLGGTGVVEAAVIGLALARGRLAPMKNLDEPDSRCDLNDLRDTALAKSVEIALPNSFAFGGHNVGLVFGPHPHATDAVPRIPLRRPEMAPIYSRAWVADFARVPLPAAPPCLKAGKDGRRHHASYRPAGNRYRSNRPEANRFYTTRKPWRT